MSIFYHFNFLHVHKIFRLVKNSSVYPFFDFDSFYCFLNLESIIIQQSNITDNNIDNIK